MTAGLIYELTKRDFTERYSGSVLGSAWSFIWPLVMIFIYMVIFSKIMSARLPGNSSVYSYSIYLVAGVLPWTAFATTVSRSASVYIEKKNIISKVNISLLRLPMFIVFSETVTFLFSMVLFFIFMVVTGEDVFSYKLFILLFVFVLQQIFAYSIGLLFGIFSVFIKDLKEVLGVIMQVWFWFTPIVYVSSILPESTTRFLKYNPSYYFINAYQKIIAFREYPDFNMLIQLALISHIILIAAYIFFRALEKDIRDFI
ncbi:MAG TPA: ABC transporter permease [Deferribacteraceae bacterium]|nr:ABC transporter permease [Deferribacteraceae bacterium]